MDQQRRVELARTLSDLDAAFHLARAKAMDDWTERALAAGVATCRVLADAFEPQAAPEDRELRAIVTEEGIDPTILTEIAVNLDELLRNGGSLPAEEALMQWGDTCCMLSVALSRNHRGMVPVSLSR